MYCQPMGAEHIALGRAGKLSHHGNHHMRYNGWDLL